MKSLFWSLAKLNTIAFGLLMVFAFWLGGKPNTKAAIFVVIYAVYIIYLNIKTIYQARQDIAKSLREGAINAAAGAIEFREAARARVDERLEERRRQSNDGYAGLNLGAEEQFSEAIRCEDINTVRKLLSSHLISPHGCNKNGRGWLQYATVIGSIKTAEIILQAGASPQDKDGIGRTAIEEAEIRDNSALIALFRKGV